MGALFHLPFQKYLDEHKCSIFVETGTGSGSCLQFARKFNLDKLYSIELDEEFVNQLRWIEKADDRVLLINDYSTKALEILIPQLPKDKSVIFWNDAHFAGNADFRKMSYEESLRNYGKDSLPLEDELKIITKYRDISRDVFLIDDWCIFQPEIEHESKANGVTWRYQDLQKELNLNTSEDQILPFFTNHNIEISLLDQAYLIATPK